MMVKYYKQVFLPITKSELQAFLRNNPIDVGYALYAPRADEPDGDKFVFSGKIDLGFYFNSGVPTVELQADDVPGGVLVHAAFTHQKPVRIVCTCISAVAILMQIAILISFLAAPGPIYAPMFLPTGFLLLLFGFMTIGLRVESNRYLAVLKWSLNENNLSED